MSSAAHDPSSPSRSQKSPACPKTTRSSCAASGTWTAWNSRFAPSSPFYPCLNSHPLTSHLQFALEHLAHPSLPSEFADDIITVLVRHAKSDDYSLPLAYYHTTQPALQTSSALELLFGALARTTVTEALYFSRTHPSATRRQLFEKLVASVLEHPQGSGARGKELVSLPLTGEEEQWFQEYIAVGEGRKSKNAKAVAQMRQLVTGRQRGGLGGQGAAVRAGR